MEASKVFFFIINHINHCEWAENTCLLEIVAMPFEQQTKKKHENLFLVKLYAD